MKRSIISLLILALVFEISTAAPVSAAASENSCRTKAASKAASQYNTTAKEFIRCSNSIAGGSACIASIRDGRVQLKLTKNQQTVLGGCEDPIAGIFGFPSDDVMAQTIMGTAAGEGRQVVDRVYGRVPSALSSTQQKCAKQLAKQGTKAGKNLIKRFIRCGNGCTSGDLAKVDQVFAKALKSINSRCSTTDTITLMGIDATAYLDEIRGGAERVVVASAVAANPIMSILDPTFGQIITPAGVPTPVDVSGIVSNTPHAGYTLSVSVQGQDAPFNPVSGLFETQLSVTPTGTQFPITAKALTYFGNVSTTTNVLFNLGSLAPDVVISSPATGTITQATSVTVSGTVIGDLSSADVLLVAGVPTAFNSGTGAFSTSVTLSGDEVEILEASVQSVGLGTNQGDSIVILNGPSVPLGLRVPDANHNRLNNSGFVAVTGLIQSQLAPAIDPANFIGTPAAGGTVCEFSVSGSDAAIAAAGANTVDADIGLNNFHIKVCDIDVPLFGSCDGFYDASRVDITLQADLLPTPGGDLSANVTGDNTAFTNGNGGLTGGFFCDFAELFAGDIEAQFEEELATQLGNLLPSGINTALAGLNVSGPIGDALDVAIDAIYTDIIEDASGVTFELDANITALNPVPDAPNFTSTLAPVPAGLPVLEATEPDGGQPYDLGFCLTNGFLNRFFGAFMKAGMFNQSISEIPFGANQVTLATNLLSLLLGDDSYNTACPNCPVTLDLRPTAAAVARAPEPLEDADIVMVVPNYQIDLVADNGGTPVILVSGTLVFELPITLGANGATIDPIIGTPSVSNVRVQFNPIGADEVALAGGVTDLFPLAASSLGGLFSSVPLPPFEGLELSAVDSGYNVSCAALYLSFGS